MGRKKKSVPSAARWHLLLLILFVVVVAGQNALPKVPNVDKVYVNGHKWVNPVKPTWRGTGGVRNDFGLAYDFAGEQWTYELCQEDTDGDGFTNGEELGDPDCVWVEGATPDRTDDISNPGLWSSVPQSTYPSRMQSVNANCMRDIQPPTDLSERELLRAEAQDFQVPYGNTGVSSTSQLAAVLKPSYTPTAFSDDNCPHLQQDLIDWHEPNIWPEGLVPTHGDDVVVPADRKVLVSSCSTPAEGFGKVIIPETSELIFADGVIHFVAKEIEVRGKLIIGSRSCPISSPITITFTGTKAQEGSFTNGMTAVDQGSIQMFGVTFPLTWSRLRATLPTGSRYIVLQDAVEWSVGEELLITTTARYDLPDTAEIEVNSETGTTNHWQFEHRFQNEIRRISAIHRTNKSLLQLDAPVDYAHYAGNEYQAEVGHLWRSILIRTRTWASGSGADSNDDGGGGGQEPNPATNDHAGYGGFISASGAFATLQVSGVRANALGQRHSKDRFPFVINGTVGASSFIQQVACVNSYHRCAAIIGTNGSSMTQNVAFNVTGHAFSLGSGAEMFNNISFNLAAHVVALGTPAGPGTSAGNGQHFASDSHTIDPTEHAASGFYLPNMFNRVVGNAASGGWSGYLLPLVPFTDVAFNPDNGMLSYSSFHPSEYPILAFNGNSAHSAGTNWSSSSCVYFAGLVKFEEGFTEQGDVIQVRSFTVAGGMPAPSEDEQIDSGHYPTKSFADPMTGTRYNATNTVSNLRTWLCQNALHSVSTALEVRNLETADCMRSIDLHGSPSSVVGGMITGVSGNQPYEMRGINQGRQVVMLPSSYDQQLILSDIDVVNLWRMLGDQLSISSLNANNTNRSAIFTAQTSSDVMKPGAGTAASEFTLHNCDTSIILRHRVQESGSSRFFNLVSEDDSVLRQSIAEFRRKQWENTGRYISPCAGWIVGSNGEWWNAGADSCFLEERMAVWVCERIPGREIVTLDMSLIGLTTSGEVNEIPDPITGLLSQSQKNSLYWGRVSQFGSVASVRTIPLTKNPKPMVTGLSGMGWYIWSEIGMPTVATIAPLQFPRGTFTLLALSYPPNTTFQISASRFANGPTDSATFTKASSRSEVASGGGTFYHFDGQHLYIKVVDLWSPRPGSSYSKNGSSVHDVMEFAQIVIQASCPSNYSNPFKYCSATAWQPPAAVNIPIVVCNNTDDADASPLCPQLTNVSPSAWRSTCSAFSSTTNCSLGIPAGACDAMCSMPQCRRTLPYPYTCSINKTAQVIGTKRCRDAIAEANITKRDHQCVFMNNHPATDQCRLPK